MQLYWIATCFALLVGWLMPVSVRAAAQTTPVDRVVVEKSARILRLYAGQTQVVAFPVALGRSPVGAKECEGDNKTPEGVFRIVGRKSDTAYFRSLRLSYPQAANVAHAASRGCQPGGNIMIHGLRDGFGWIGRLHRWLDWTHGCIALTNEEVAKVAALVADGTVVEIRP